MSSIFGWLADMKPVIIALIAIYSINYWLKIIANGVLTVVSRMPDAVDERRNNEIYDSISKIEELCHSLKNISYSLSNIEDDLRNIKYDIGYRMKDVEKNEAEFMMDMYNLNSKLDDISRSEEAVVKVLEEIKYEIAVRSVI